MVGLRDRVVEEHVDAVARVVLERRLELGDAAAHDRVVLAQDPDDLLRVGLFAEGGEPAEVREHDGQLPAVALEEGLALGRRDELRDPRREEPGELRALAFHRREQPRIVVAQPLVGQACPDARLEQRRLDRPGQVVGGTHLDTPDDPVEVVEPGHDDHGDVCEGGIGLDRRERLEPVDLGHHEIEQHEVARAVPAASRSRASRPSAASAVSWPSRSRSRTSVIRFIRLSSTTRTCPGPGWPSLWPVARGPRAGRPPDGRRRGHERQPALRATSSAIVTLRELGGGRVDPWLSVRGVAVAGLLLERPGDLRERGCADVPAVALERVRMAAECRDVPGVERLAHPRQLGRSVGEVGVHDVADELAVVADHVEHLRERRRIERGHPVAPWLPATPADRSASARASGRIGLDR